MALIRNEVEEHHIDTDLERYLSEKTGDLYTTFWCIIKAESGWHPQARHWNPNGTWDIGLMQVNDVHGASILDRLDPYKNIDMGLSLYASRGLQPWVASRHNWQPCVNRLTADSIP